MLRLTSECMCAGHYDPAQASVALHIPRTRHNFLWASWEAAADKCLHAHSASVAPQCLDAPALEPFVALLSPFHPLRRQWLVPWALTFCQGLSRKPLCLQRCWLGAPVHAE
jgi:anti-sigma factor ChrR (cupin superfamily)